MRERARVPSGRRANFASLRGLRGSRERNSAASSRASSSLRQWGPGVIGAFASGGSARRSHLHWLRRARAVALRAAPNGISSLPGLRGLQPRRRDPRCCHRMTTPRAVRSRSLKETWNSPYSGGRFSGAQGERLGRARPALGPCAAGCECVARHRFGPEDCLRPRWDRSPNHGTPCAVDRWCRPPYCTNSHEPRFQQSVGSMQMPVLPVGEADPPRPVALPRSVRRAAGWWHRRKPRWPAGGCPSPGWWGALAAATRPVSRRPTPRQPAVRGGLVGSWVAALGVPRVQESQDRCAPAEPAARRPGGVDRAGHPSLPATPLAAVVVRPEESPQWTAVSHSGVLSGRPRSRLWGTPSIPCRVPRESPAEPGSRHVPGPPLGPASESCGKTSPGVARSPCRQSAVRSAVSWLKEGPRRARRRVTSGESSGAGAGPQSKNRATLRPKTRLIRRVYGRKTGSLGAAGSGNGSSAAGPLGPK